MLSKIIYAIRYRINELNSKKVIGKNNQIINQGSFYGTVIEIFGDNNSIEVGGNSILRGVNIHIKGNNIKLNIGNSVSIKGGDLWLEDDATKIWIGSNTTIEKAHIAVTEYGKEIKIGKDCMIAKEVEIRSGDSHSIIDDKFQRINHAKNILIGNHVWIGNRAIILKGVEIGDNSIIATGAIVTSNVPINVISGGIPSKTIKENINWKRERI